MRLSPRRTATLLAVPSLVLSGLLATGSAASADPVTDPAPAAAGAGWLEHQLTDGLVHNDQYDFDDYGLSIDVALALDALGGHETTVGTVSDAVAAHVRKYVTGNAFGDKGSHYAGATAKALWLAEISGADEHDFGGLDLQQSLEDRVATDAPITGRLQDVSAYGDSANVIGQIYAAEALTQLSSDRASDVRAFLLQQQCADGYFRLNFAPSLTKGDQSCDGGTAKASAPDTDVTALFVLAMRPFAADEAVSSAVDGAVAWLADQQATSGAFGGGPTTEAPNANSTGLAGWALADSGDAAAGARAAAWIRAHQVANVGACTPFRKADVGAVAYDDPARKALSGHRITQETQDQFRRASAQAVPVLQWAEQAGEPHVLSAPEYVDAGSTTQIGVIGAAPGEALCAQRLPSGDARLGWANADGEAHLRVAVPNRTAGFRYAVENAGGPIGTARVNALAAADLRVGLAARRIAAGRTQVVTVRGLAAGEDASVSITWPERGSSSSGAGFGGQANDRGVFQVSVRVPRGRGTASVEAVGERRSRHGHTSFVVTR